MAAEGSDRKKLVRPNKDEHQKLMEEYKKKIADVRHKLDFLQGKIPSKDANNPANSKRTAARTAFDTLLNEKKALLSKKQALWDQLKQAQNSIKKKTEELKNSKSKLGFKSVAEIDGQISTNESLLQRGGIPLSEEKRLVSEISNLKKNRKVLESLSSQPLSIESDKKKSDEIRGQLKELDAGIAKLELDLNQAKSVLTALDKEIASNRDSVADLFKERKDLSAQLSKLREEKDAAGKSYKNALDEWFAYEKEQYKLREEARKLEQKKERDAKLLEQAERDLENAELPAFGDEIALCNAIVNILKNLSGEKTEDAVEEATSVAAGRQVNETDSKPKGATVLVSKRDQDDDYLVLGNKKKNKKQNKKASAQEATRAIKLDPEMIDHLTRLKIDLPRIGSDIPTTIASLQELIAGYKKNQEKQTAANKAAALEKLNKLKDALAEEEMKDSQVA